MNRVMRNFLILSTTTLCFSLHATVTPYLALRSQGFNAAREIVGWQTQIHKFDVGACYGSFSVTPEYTQSFRSYDIQEWLFDDALTNIAPYLHIDNTSCRKGLVIQGTKVTDRNHNALMAENFYLPPDFSSVISFKPTIENELIDFNLYIGLDKWCDGLFFRVHSPLVHTRWDLGMHEHVINKGSQNYDVGYYDKTFTSSYTDPLVYGIARDQLLDNFTDYACACKKIADHDGITYRELTHARMSTHALSKTGLAELTAQLGWDFCLGQEYHCGIAIRTAAPTGTRPTGTWLFEPIVGNGHHWELGGSLTAHWCSWKNFCETLAINTYVDINVTHLFSAHQCRTFDLWCNPLSRYMMSMRFTASTHNLKAINAAKDVVYPPTAQFAQEFVPLANISTIPVDVSAAIQGEFIIKFALSYKNYQLDLGYNFWGRTCLDIYRSCDCRRDDFIDYRWGMKGDAFAYGFQTYKQDDTVTAIAQPGIPLSATESNATIFNGCNNWPHGLEVHDEQEPWCANPGIDNPQLAYSNTTHELSTKQIDPDNPGAPTYGWHHVNTSINPVLLTFNDLDIDRARTRSMSHKAFAHFDYTWHEHLCLTPYVGFGAEIEFGQQDDCCNHSCNRSCVTKKTCSSPLAPCCIKDNQCSSSDNCKTIALSQWGIWIKGGFSF